MEAFLLIQRDEKFSLIDCSSDHLRFRVRSGEDFDEGVDLHDSAIRLPDKLRGLAAQRAGTIESPASLDGFPTTETSLKGIDVCYRYLFSCQDPSRGMCIMRECFGVEVVHCVWTAVVVETGCLGDNNAMLLAPEILPKSIRVNLLDHRLFALIVRCHGHEFLP